MIMPLMKEIIEKLLEEVDPDIKEIMLKKYGEYEGYELFSDSPNFILKWQALRDRKNEHSKTNSKS